MEEELVHLKCKLWMLEHNVSSEIAGKMLNLFIESEGKIHIEKQVERTLRKLYTLALQENNG